MTTAAWALALLFAALAAACDLRWRRIPNALTAPAAGIGLLLGLVSGREAPVLAAAAAGWALGYLLWRLGAVGGGDVKLLATLGALLGWRLWFWSLEFGLIAAGVVAVVQLAHRRRLHRVPRVWSELAAGWRRYGVQPHAEHNAWAARAVTAPFAVPMMLGVICALWWR